MAVYKDIKTILKQFELQIVQQKHYTKAQSDNKYMTKASAGTQVTYSYDSSTGTLTITTK